MTAGPTCEEDLHINMLLCNKVQTLFHRTRLMGINPWSTVVRFHQRTVGGGWGGASVHELYTHALASRPVKLCFPSRTCLKDFVTMKRRNYILMLPTETVVVFLLNGWVVITGRRKKNKKTNKQKKPRLAPDAWFQWERAPEPVWWLARVQDFQVSWIKHHFYTTLFCFTQCALKISNNIAISIQSCGKMYKTRDKPLQVS